jgi:hypothetical protein
MPDTEEARFRFSACLRIKDVPHLHAEIIDQLGPGTENHKEGDVRQLEPLRKWRNSIWIMSAPVAEEEDLGKHLGWVSGFAKTHERFLRDLMSRGAKIDIYMSYACSDDHRGFGLAPELLEIFPKLGIRFEMSVMT